MKYVGQTCTSCRQIFKEDDDIVVCPECGSPYHRDCYKNEGRCVNTLLHEKGETWSPEETVSENGAGAPIERVCPNCGTHNGAEAAFCSGCGLSLNGQIGQQSPRPAAGDYNYGAPVFGGQPMNGMPQFLNIRTIPSDTDVDGNTVGDYSEYVGGKFYYYIPKFLRFSKSRSKFSFNFAAFFFSPFWFAYRKMPLYSAISVFASVLFGLPSVLVNVHQMGIVSFPWINSRGFMIIDTLFYILSYVFSLACGLFGNWLYYRKAKADIERIKASQPDRMLVARRLQIEGGVSMGYVWAALGAMFLFSMVISAVLML